MNVADNFDLFADAFPTDLLPAIFALILEEWPHAPRPEGNPLENRITNRFVGYLRMVMRKTKMPQFNFQCRPKLPDPDSDSEVGEFDIYINSFSPHPDAYFVFECKRLNVTYDSGFQSEASEYVGDGGMGCFISGQYPATCGCGGMLGYVMDGKVPVAIEAVNQALDNKQQPLRLRPPAQLTQAEITPNENRVYQTTHDIDQGEFLIYHLLLEY